MTEQINGLLTQKPDSPIPAAGNTQRFSWEQRTGKSGKPYIKVKNEGEGFGQVCEVVSAEKTDFTDTHGNVSFNVSFLPQDDAAGANGGAAPAAPSDRDDQINRAVAFKGAVEIACATGETSPESISSLTAALLPIVKGAADPKPQAPQTGGGGTAMDSDIPFA